MKKILIVKLSSIGDVVHTLPSLKALRETFKKGEAIVDWLVEDRAKELLQAHPLLDRVIVVRRRGWLLSPLENIRIARWIASQGYDMVIDFQGLFKSGIWVMLSKGKRRIGFSNARELSYIFLNERLPSSSPERHAVDRYLDLARYAGGVVKDVEFPVVVEDGRKKRVVDILEREGIDPDGGFFVIVPRARWTTKMWSDERFAELSGLIFRRFGLRGVVVGSRSDREGLNGICRKDTGVVNLAGLLDLKELFYLMGLSGFALTVDSGPMHIAVAARTRVVCIFGPTSPVRTGPYGEGHMVIRKDLPCSPCFLKHCDDMRCMKEITVEDVMKAVEGMVEVRGKGAGYNYNPG